VPSINDAGFLGRLWLLPLLVLQIRDDVLRLNGSMWAWVLWQFVRSAMVSTTFHLFARNLSRPFSVRFNTGSTSIRRVTSCCSTVAWFFFLPTNYPFFPHDFTHRNCMLTFGLPSASLAGLAKTRYSVHSSNPYCIRHVDYELSVSGYWCNSSPSITRSIVLRDFLPARTAGTTPGTVTVTTGGGGIATTIATTLTTTSTATSSAGSVYDTTTSASGAPTPLGPIIGGVVGGVALMALLALGFTALLLGHKRKLRRLSLTAAAASVSQGETPPPPQPKAAAAAVDAPPSLPKSVSNETPLGPSQHLPLASTLAAPTLVALAPSVPGVHLLDGRAVAAATRGGSASIYEAPEKTL
jgi:hypothetical protein